jgi:hypothetical protein
LITFHRQRFGISHDHAVAALDPAQPTHAVIYRKLDQIALWAAEHTLRVP